MSFLRNILVAIALALSLGACSTTGMLPKDPVGDYCTSSPSKAVQCGIDNANAAIAAASQTVFDGFINGSISRDRAWKFSYEFEKASLWVDEAERLLKIGEVLEAKDKLEMAEVVIQLVEKELVKYATDKE